MPEIPDSTTRMSRLMRRDRSLKISGIEADFPTQVILIAHNQLT